MSHLFDFILLADDLQYVFFAERRVQWRRLFAVR
jgi:hypothetical protein